MQEYNQSWMALLSKDNPKNWHLWRSILDKISIVEDWSIFHQNKKPMHAECGWSSS